MRPVKRQGVRASILHLAALVLALIAFAPFVWALRLSLEPSFSTAVPLLPRQPTLENFRNLLLFTPFARWVLNSLIFAGSLTVSNVLLDAAAGYVLARRRLPASDLIFTGVLALLMVPHQVTLIPLYLIINALGLVDTYAGLILPLAATSFGIFVMRQFIGRIPIEYEEAATVDGASRLRVFFSVIIPLSRPALLVVAVTTFVEAWNNFIFPLVMITRNELRTVTLGLSDFTYATLNVNWGMTMAGALLGALPAVVLFVLLNRSFMEGFSIAGGTRG